jgi:hypothetical protein
MEHNSSLSSDTQFQKRLSFGQMAETRIARWILRKGAIILPIYDIEYETGKGPRIFGIDEQLIAPDLLVFLQGKMYWIEAKHKSVFTWYRKGKCWTTGIDLHHYRQYFQVEVLLGFPIRLLFLHECSTPAAIDRRYQDCPDECPVGLFGQTLQYLKEHESHRSMKHGPTGMVYWAYETLELRASLSELAL